MPREDLLPSTKIATASIAGSLTVLVVWVASLFGLEVPTVPATALTVLFTAGAGYLVPESSGKHSER